MRNLLLLFFMIVALLFQVKAQTEEIKIHGESVYTYTLRNESQMNIRLSNYGARILSLYVLDKNGNSINVIKGPEKAADYEKNPTAGATIGRYANRIAKGLFVLDGIQYQLDINNGNNSLHGGFSGFADKIWKVIEQDSHHIRFSYRSADREGGFPGDLYVEVTYTLNSQNELEIAYKATTDKNTVINLTNHAYFNLNGQSGQDISNTEVRIHADYITPVDKELIPTGDLLNVTNTVYDFRRRKAIKKNSYDHNFVLKQQEGLKLAAEAYSPLTGILMTVHTEEPGVQFYTGNFSAFCFETQHFPDSPNQGSFPSTVLKKDQTFHSKTVYKFGITDSY